MIDKTEATEIVKRYITDRGGQADPGIYRAKREGDRWWVGVEWIIGYEADGTPLHTRGGHVLFEIDEEGRVVRCYPGR